MEFTMDTLKEKLWNRGWDITQENAMLLMISEDNIHRFELAEEVSKSIHHFVFRHQIDKYKMETYVLPFHYKNKLFMYRIWTKHGMGNTIRVELTEIDSHRWYQVGNGLSVPEELRKLKEDFTQAVLDLPEFRLFAATGILSVKKF